MYNVLCGKTKQKLSLCDKQNTRHKEHVKTKDRLLFFLT